MEKQENILVLDGNIEDSPERLAKMKEEILKFKDTLEAKKSQVL